MFTLHHIQPYVFTDGSNQIRIQPVTGCCIRISAVMGQAVQDPESLIVLPQELFTEYQYEETESFHILKTTMLKVKLCKKTGSIQYEKSDGRLLLTEKPDGGKWFVKKKVHRIAYNPEQEAVTYEGADGMRSSTQGQEIFDRMAFEAKLEFVFEEGEALYGLGSHEEGYGNLRGKSRELYQNNLKAAVPVLTSTKHYGLLFDCCSFMTFHDDVLGSYFWFDTVSQLDYYFMAGESHDDVIYEYRKLTGSSPLLPKWAFGYTQSKERYKTAEELIAIVKEYRRRKLPLDLIVLDWHSWPEGFWGQKTFDPARFPDPEKMMKQIHEEHARLMISIWPNMTGKGENQLEMMEKGYLLGNQSTYNAFDEEARHCYFEQARRGLFQYGIDAFWCDCTEPFEEDWGGPIKPEPHKRAVMNVNAAKKYLDASVTNAYSLCHSKGIYEGMRRAFKEKRVYNLTRSSYAGQHRYGTVTWSGDISASWEVLKRQIPEGIHFSASGEPYWSVDIGAFFVGTDKNSWFIRGEYPNGVQDLGYRELYVRYMQFGIFLPICRSHGSGTPRELWQFGEPGGLFYDALFKAVGLRYQLIPYIYSLSAYTAFHGGSFLYPPAMDFPMDKKMQEIDDQFLFGHAILVCPVTKPMYYGKESAVIAESDKTRSVYLPSGSTWYDFWTNEFYTGGVSVEADAPLDKIPLYIKSGSILPTCQVMQYVDEIPDAPYTIRIYAGNDGQFDLYEDAGDGWAYENGEFAIVRFHWEEQNSCFTIEERQGNFPGMVNKREYQIVLVSAGHCMEKKIQYSGSRIQLQFAD